MAGGFALLINCFVPIALTLITAIMFNTTVLYFLHDPSGIGPAAFCLIVGIVFLYAKKERLSPFSTYMSIDRNKHTHNNVQTPLKRVLIIARSLQQQEKNANENNFIPISDLNVGWM